MFNPEKLLGGMLRSGKRGKTMGSLATGGAALGIVGVAMAAAEHYLNKPSGTAPQSTGVPPAAPPAAPGMGSGPPSASPPPPPPAVSVSPTSSEKQQTDAILLIRAMIAAANADGIIDADERANILDKLKSVDLTTEEHAFIVHELLAPKPVEDLLGQVKSPEMARQVYAASLLSINVDTDKERIYMQNLSHQLQLDDQVVDDIHRQIELQ